MDNPESDRLAVQAHALEAAMSDFDNGRYVGAWRLELDCRGCGCRLVWRRWHRTEEGWDEDVLELHDADAAGLDGLTVLEQS